VLSDRPDPAALRALLSLIEQTVPAPLIVIKSAEAPDAFGQPFEDSAQELKLAMEAVFSAMVDAGRAERMQHAHWCSWSRSTTIRSRCGVP